jgi:hypothetical protein
VSAGSVGVDPTLIVNILTAAGAIGTAIFGSVMGIRSYRQSQEIKKKDVMKEILFPLMEEFDDKDEKMREAKYILDDVPITFGDKEQYYDEAKLLLTLRDHRDTTINVPWSYGDGIIRSSFDSFLDFLVKIEYLYSIGMLSEKELAYFKYYIDKAANNKAVVNYVKTYAFPLHGNLHSALNSE